MFGSNKSLNIKTISDIHLGHNITRAEDTIVGLNEAIPDRIESAELDIVFLAGDVFDEALMHNDDDVHHIQLWIANLLRICKKYDIALRVLEGTPSHDRNQSKHFITINEAGQFNADVEYIDTLCIKYMEKFDIHVLYIPDEWGTDTDSTWQEVTEVMRKHGLDKVDFCIMHGMFEYQLPPHLDFQHHKTDRYLGITRHYVFIGHVHTPSQYERILVPGSFDRCCQGEEENKGYWHVRVTRDDSPDDIKHITNPHATVYTRVDCRGMELSDALESLKFVDDLRTNSSVEIHCMRGSEISTSIDSLRLRYPGIRFKYKIEKADTETIGGDADLGTKYKSVELTRSNIHSEVMDRVSNMETDPVVLNKASELLRALL